MQNDAFSAASRWWLTGVFAAGFLCIYPGLLPPVHSLALASAVFAAALALRIKSPRIGSSIQNAALIILLVVFVPFSIWVSSLREVSMQSAAVLLWCIAVMLAAERWIACNPLHRALVLLACTAIVFSGIALLTMESMPKFPLLSGLNALLPHVRGAVGIPKGGLPANELGGTAAFMVPVLTALLFVRPHSDARMRYAIPLAALLTVAVLLLAQSRGAYLAAILGLAVALWLSGRRARVMLGVLLALLVAGIAIAGLDTVTGTLSYHRRYDSLFPILSGRDEIWLRAWMLVRDIPLFGVGIGTFGLIAAQVYPFRFGTGGPIEDAHNLFAQTALDFGVAGAVLFILFLGSLIILLIRRRQSQSGALNAGLLGACTAYILFNITDAVALFSPASAVAFVLFATARAQSLNEGRTGLWKPFAVCGTLVICAWLATMMIRPAGEQVAILKYIEYIAGPDADNRTMEMLPKNPSPNLLWYSGLLAGVRGDSATRAVRWKALAQRDAAYIPFMAWAAPHDEKLARVVHTNAPNSAEASFWLARTVAVHAPKEAAGLFRRGLSINGADGWAWLGLGDALQASGDTAAAHRAYVKACYNDDPGLNGCWRAAKTAIALGDTATALRYYEISNFAGAKKRAAQLRGTKGDVP